MSCAGSVLCAVWAGRDAESLDEDYCISVACLEDSYSSSGVLREGVLSAPLEGVWDLRAFRDGEGNAGSPVSGSCVH